MIEGQAVEGGGGYGIYRIVVEMGWVARGDGVFNMIDKGGDIFFLQNIYK